MERCEPFDQQKIETARRQMSASILQQLYNAIRREDKERSPAQLENIRRQVLGIIARAPVGGGVVGAAGAAAIIDPWTAYLAAPPPPGVAFLGMPPGDSWNPPTWLLFVAALYRVAGVARMWA